MLAPALPFDAAVILPNASTVRSVAVYEPATTPVTGSSTSIVPAVVIGPPDNVNVDEARSTEVTEPPPDSELIVIKLSAAVLVNFIFVPSLNSTLLFLPLHYLNCPLGTHPSREWINPWIECGD